MRLSPPSVSLHASRPSMTLSDLATLSAAALDNEERAHAARLRSASARAQFVTRRSQLRNELAFMTGTRHEEIRYWREPCARCGGAHGRPRAEGFDGYFSTSSAAHVSALALDERPVGIDVEALVPMATVRDVTSSLHPHERAAIDTAKRRHPDDARRVFTQIWVRKEALLKATGEGLTARLDRDDVSAPAERPVPGWRIVDITTELAGFDGPPTCGAWATATDEFPSAPT